MRTAATAAVATEIRHRFGIHTHTECTSYSRETRWEKRKGHDRHQQKTRNSHFVHSYIGREYDIFRVCFFRVCLCVLLLQPFVRLLACSFQFYVLRQCAHMNAIPSHRQSSRKTRTAQTMPHWTCIWIRNSNQQKERERVRTIPTATHTLTRNTKIMAWSRWSFLSPPTLVLSTLIMQAVIFCFTLVCSSNFIFWIYVLLFASAHAHNAVTHFELRQASLFG